MPSFKQSVTIQTPDTAQAAAIVYGTFLSLGWPLKYAGEQRMIGYTPKSWKTFGEEIMIDLAPQQMTIQSSMQNDAVMDISKRNKKNTEKFREAFEQVQARATASDLQQWATAMEQLKSDTVIAASEEQRTQEEVDKVMNLSKGGKQVTYGIIAINVIVFILMVISGVGFMSPEGGELIKWGSNYGLYTLSGEWWRLLTNVFVHIGIIHLLFNMYALFIIGGYLEPMLGKTRYLAAYLCTGIIASVTSLWWHDGQINSAGASGAIFGMYGVFLALLTTSLIPKQVRKGLLQSIGIFVFYNLVYGMKAGVDNAAHMGGLVSGFIMGYLYYLTLKGERSNGKIFTVTATVILATLLLAFTYVNKGPNDSAKFIKQYDEMIELQDKALAPLKHAANDDRQMLAALKDTSLPNWNKAAAIIKETETYQLPDNLQQKRSTMKQYIGLRLQQTQMLVKIIEVPSTSDNAALDSLTIKINQTVEEMNKGN